jgi:hypothetical protein
VFEPNRTRSPWRKSRSSGVNGCVEVATDKGNVYIRDSKSASERKLRLTREQWIDFISQIKNGHPDVRSHKTI